jgi:hypothetical protein
MLAATTEPPPSDQGAPLATVASGSNHGDVVFETTAGITAVTLNLNVLSLTLQLSAATFVAGDYWLIDVRTAAPNPVNVTSPTPVGVTHNYLTVGTWNGSQLTLTGDTGIWRWGTVPLATVEGEINGKVNKSGDTMTGPLLWGGNGSMLTFAQGGSLDLGGNPESPGTGTPFINFHYQGLQQPFNTQIINDANGQLSLVAGSTHVSGNLGLDGELTFRASQRPGQVNIVNDIPGRLNVESTIAQFTGVVSVGQTLLWANNSMLSLDQGGSLELGGNDVTMATGAPYVDFHFNGKLEDYNVRLQNDRDGRLGIYAGATQLNGRLNVSDLATGIGALGAPLLTVGAINSLPLGSGLAQNLYAGDIIIVSSPASGAQGQMQMQMQTWTVSADTAAGARLTSIPVQPEVPNFAYPAGSSVAIPAASIPVTRTGAGETASALVVSAAGAAGAGALAGAFTAQADAPATATALSCSVTATNSGDIVSQSPPVSYGLFVEATATTGQNAPVVYAAWLQGDTHIQGNFTKPLGEFLIDHPLEPHQKTLRHRGVESPEPLCVYRGRAALGPDGNAVVELPSYFAALTDEENATVHVTPIGEEPFGVSYAWNADHDAVTVRGAPDREVAYLVMAARDDPVVLHLLRPVEEEKGNGHFEAGKLLMPAAFVQEGDGEPDEGDPGAPEGVS